MFHLVVHLNAAAELSQLLSKPPSFPPSADVTGALPVPLGHPGMSRRCPTGTTPTLPSRAPPTPSSPVIGQHGRVLRLGSPLPPKPSRNGPHTAVPSGGNRAGSIERRAGPGGISTGLATRTLTNLRGLRRHAAPCQVHATRVNSWHEGPAGLPVTADHSPGASVNTVRMQ